MSKITKQFFRGLITSVSLGIIFWAQSIATTATAQTIIIQPYGGTITSENPEVCCNGILFEEEKISENSIANFSEDKKLFDTIQMVNQAEGSGLKSEYSTSKKTITLLNEIPLIGICITIDSECEQPKKDTVASYVLMMGTTLPDQGLI